MSGPYGKAKDAMISTAKGVGGIVGYEGRPGFSRKVKKALIGIPEADEKTRMNEFKARYRKASSIEEPGGGTNPGFDGEAP